MEYLFPSKKLDIAMNTGTYMHTQPSSSQILELPAEGQDTRYGTSYMSSSLIAGVAIGRSVSKATESSRPSMKRYEVELGKG